MEKENKNLKIPETPPETSPASSEAALDQGVKPQEGAMEVRSDQTMEGAILRTDAENYDEPLSPSDGERIPPKGPSGGIDESECLLFTRGVTMQFGGLTAVSDFNLRLKKGSITALIGPNGAGKTTAFNMITGVYRPTQGQIFFEGKDITGLKPDAITRLGVARTFQNIRLFRDLTVFENVLIGNHLRMKENALTATLRTPFAKREEARVLEKSEALLRRVGLFELRNEKAGSLPYGRQRRLEIARAMATDPKVLFLDEPAAGMNPTETADLTEFIREIRKEFDLTIFMIEHHMQVVMDISEHIYVFDYGVTIAEGTAREIQNNNRVIVAYLGVDEDA
ncbi:Branched-chain amino acid transport ATP-binding protein LivG [Clostridiaceae bacterium JG1575]|nr:Branched-chain amino acid transport ATP-binding protein LivG [Clostridiaceae bacterium JG1575]